MSQPIPKSSFDSSGFNALYELWEQVGKYNVNLVNAPASASDSGVPISIAADSSYIYICVDTDTWKRVAISTW